MKVLITFFGLAFSALLPLINPLGSSLVFLGLVPAASPDVYRALAQRIAISTTLFLVIIEVAGTAMLKFFGISLPVMQVTGGIVLATMGRDMLSDRDSRSTEPATEASLADGDLQSAESKVFYPLTFPITAGPGCIVVLITLSAHASAEHGFADVAAHAGIMLAVVMLSVLVYVCYGFAPAIAARVRPQTAHGVLRVIAFVLMCIGVQIAWNGAELLIRSLPPR